MARLPFVVEPRLKPIIERIGTEESGVLEIERRGYLTAGEKNFVQQVQQSDSSANSVIGLARRVSRAHNLGLESSYNIIMGIIAGSSAADDELANKIESEFAEDIQKVLSDLTNSQNRLDLVQAACLIINRIDNEFKIEDIVKQHPDLIEGLAILYREEEAKSIEKLKAAETEENALSVEEIEKKPTRKKVDG
jgi:hypothetical protein